MKAFTIFLFFVLTKPHHSLAQTDRLQPPEKDVICITKLLDSLPYFIKTGQAYLEEKSECLLPDHNNYMITHIKRSFSKQTLKYTGDKKRAYVEMSACNDVATEFYNKQDYAQTKKWLLKALDIAIREDFQYDELHVYRVGLNNVFFHLGDYSEAMKISTEGLIKSEKINDRERIMHYNNVLGYIMMKQKNFELSEKYYSTELLLARQLNNKVEEAKALVNLADLYITGQKELPKAVSFIHDALDIYQKTDQATADTSKLFGIIERTAYCNNKLANVYLLMQDYGEALQHCLVAIKISQKPINEFHGNLYDVSSYYINTGDIYNRLHKPDSALFYSRIGLKIADSIKHREDLRDAYEQLSLSFAMKKNFDSAYFYQQFFTRLKDSIQDESSRQDILMRDADLRIERERRIQQAKLSQQRLWRNIIIAGFIFMIILVIMLYNRRRVKQKILYQQQLNEQQNEMFNIAATAQEKERKRIAEDIHDGLGSVLSAAKLKLSSLEEDKKLLTEEQHEKYLAILSLLDEAAVELRNISHNIMPATLSKLGLIPALKSITDRISSHSGLQIQFEVHDFNERLEESAEISIYRIVLELLNNIVRHAQATKAVVQLIKYPDYINITVEDNGKGFDYKKILNENKGIGLSNIESRVNYQKGTFDIDSRPGRGTTIIIDMPYSVS